MASAPLRSWTYRSTGDPVVRWRALPALAFGAAGGSRACETVGVILGRRQAEVILVERMRQSSRLRRSEVSSGKKVATKAPWRCPPKPRTTSTSARVPGQIDRGELLSIGDKRRWSSGTWRQRGALTEDARRPRLRPDSVHVGANANLDLEANSLHVTLMRWKAT